VSTLISRYLKLDFISYLQYPFCKSTYKNNMARAKGQTKFVKVLESLVLQTVEAFWSWNGRFRHLMMIMKVNPKIAN